MRLLSAPGLTLLAGLAAFATLGPPESPVADAAMRGDVAAVEQLLANGADVNAPRGDGMTALHWAAERGNAELAAMLVQAGANLNAVTRIGSYTPLHVASREGEADVVGVLLDAGADLSVRAAESGATPFTWRPPPATWPPSGRSWMPVRRWMPGSTSGARRR